MASELVKAIGAIAVLLTAWLAVQRAWQTVFDGAADGDALAGRTGCHDCNADSSCENACGGRD